MDSFFSTRGARALSLFIRSRPPLFPARPRRSLFSTHAVETREHTYLVRHAEKREREEAIGREKLLACLFSKPALLFFFFSFLWPLVVAFVFFYFFISLS